MKLMRLIAALLAFAPLGAFAQISGGTGLSGGPIFTNITGSTQCLHANTNGVISGTGSDCAGGAATGANPTGTVGLATVNGSAATFLRSDGAPPLSQSITPTWTGLHKFTFADFALLGSSTGYTLLESGLSGAGNNTLTLPTTASDTLAALGTVQSWTATQNFATISATGGTLAGLTGLAIRDTSAAFDVTLAGTSSTALTAGRTLTLDMKNVAHTLAFNATANTITFPNTASYTLIGSGDTATVTNTMLATAATNTVKGNATSGSASPTDLAVGSCSTSASALNWTTNTGFGCNTAIQAATAGASFVINSNATLTAPGSAQLQLGAANAASPVNQSVLTQGSRGGTDTDVAGANLTIQSGLGTGQAAGSTITMQVPKAGSTGTTAETAVNGLVLGPTAISIGNATSNPTATFLGSGAVAVTGLLQPNAGITATGAAANLNASSNFATNINTGTSTGTATIGQNSATPSAIALNGPLTFNAGTAFSTASWGTTSPVWNGAAMTLNDTTASGPVTNDAAYSLQAPNFTSTGGASTTITSAITLYVAAPTCTTVVCSNLFSISTTGKINGSNGLNLTGTTSINASANATTSINTGTSTSALHLADGSGNNAIGIGNGTSVVTAVGAWTFNASANNAFSVNTGTSTGAIHIGDGSGNNTIGIGNGTGVVTGASPWTFSNATVKMTAITTGTNADFLCLKADGTILIQSSSCTISSLRFKTDVRNLDGSAIPEISNMRVASFRMKNGQSNRDPNAAAPQVGLIAENIARVAPECAIYENDMHTPKSYRQECIIALLVRGEQELVQQNSALRVRLAKLESRR